jgi:ATP-dependent Clp protease adaptor protein ClpS
VGVREKESVSTDREVRIAPRWNVILLDDDDHTYGYVIEMLQDLFAMPVEKAFLCACEVDRAGRVILLTTSKEHAELKQEQIHAYGPDPSIQRCKGGMSSVVEPAP